MRPDDLEFLIAQYADGTLDPQRSAELKAILDRDPSARAMLESYRSLDGVLAGLAASDPLPQLQWDQLAARLSDQITNFQAEVTLSEEAEETLSRLSSGQASAIEQSLVETRLADSTTYRLALVEYAALDRAFEGIRSSPLPAVQWDRFASHISAQIDEQEAARQQSMRLISAQAANTSVWGRIGKFAAQPRRLAVAACLLIAASVSIKMVGDRDQQPTQIAPSQTTPGGPAIVQNVPGALQVQVGPSIDLRDQATITAVQAPPPNGVQSVLNANAVAEIMRQAGSRPSQSSVSRPATRPQTKPDSLDSVNDLFPSR